MKSNLRVVEVRKDKLIEFTDGAIPLRLEDTVQPTGLVNPSPSSEKFMLYYLEKTADTAFTRGLQINPPVENTTNPF